ncbi:type II secretion system secretin GspD [Enterobacillus tribolii]|uniref:Type II secretion system protein D (GspD) n=1 Tax=Enterobacillus tribolii TaxID=1487935 RepID=A0A370Q8E5_9GAMM|nr:type II secretion system secretin GspD [Enterobacillus tribolii]MBW7984599.1 type II secretion system protein GspD [Enterobacillus tribolii]RDK84589.1 type II secretion system protein D (GspD) [Enterobacillus tribolii]
MGRFCRWLILGLCLALPLRAAEFSASFKGVDVHEFINTVSKNLNKTVIIDPGVRGTITVRSYDMLNEEQYYQFFLSVLDVYGFAVVPMENGVLKVVKAKDAKSASVPVVDDSSAARGDEVVTRVAPLHNVTARDLAPLLRQLNDNAGVGNVVHYDPSNVLLLTGRAAVINRLMQIIERVDRAGGQTVQTLPLKHASAAEVARLVTQMAQDGNKNAAPPGRIVADERTNTVMISGDDQARARLATMVRQLDKPQVSRGNTRVIYLKYANAEKLVEVLTGLSGSLESDSQGAKSGVALTKDTVVKADPQTNSLIINATPDIMNELEQVIASVDIRRPQVLVEAIIAEVQNADGLNLGIQWGHKYAGMTQFTNTGLPISSVVPGVDQYRKDGTVPTTLAGALAAFNGIAAGFYSGNWAMLLTALSSDSQNDILATPSVVTLDNKEATFNVGQEVPVLSGSQTTSGDNIFNTVERKTVGIKLRVKPQINEGDSVLLEIEQEVSSVAEGVSSSTSDLGATFNTRSVSNAVLVSSGATVVVGGLLDHSSRETTSKVPLLGDIPVVGNLFRSKSKSREKRNLMLFIRPTIIRDQQHYDRASSGKYQQFQRDDVNTPEDALWRSNGGERLDLPELGTGQGFNNVRSAIALFYATQTGAKR